MHTERPVHAQPWLARLARNIDPVCPNILCAIKHRQEYAKHEYHLNMYGPLCKTEAIAEHKRPVHIEMVFMFLK
ncbi:unnamed protein product, partial [marine sediment metagenome]